MRASTDRILTTHVGALPMPPGMWSKQGVEEARLQREVAEVVRLQREAGIDIINEGELTKGGNWVSFINQRLSGFVPVDNGATSALLMQSEDWKQFKDFYQAALAGGTLFESTRSVAEQIRELDWSCTSAITYVGQKSLQQEIECLRAALGGTPPSDAFLTSTAPASLEPGRDNKFYKDTESFLFALADSMAVEYEAIAKAGFIVQVDDAWLAALWDRIGIPMGLEGYRRYCRLRIEALNHALRNVPQLQVRYHLCWGSWHGPHSQDIGMKDMIDLLLSINAQAYLFEAANARHEHEYTLWAQVKIPEDKILIPGVVSHATAVIEHPELVSMRIQRFTHIVGRERVIAGTDCGLGLRCHPQAPGRSSRRCPRVRRLPARRCGVEKLRPSVVPGGPTLVLSGERLSNRYQGLLVLLLSFNFGVLFFDRNALNFLMQFVKPDLHLSDTQVGMLSSGLSMTFAISSILVGRLSDRLGSRKPVLIVAIVAFGLCSVVSGFATSFLLLLGARILMGAAEGGVMPVSHAMIVAEVNDRHRGLAMGVAQNLGSNLLGSAAAPLVLIPVAIAFGWRHAFYLAALPGLIGALLIWFLVREPPAEAYHAGPGPKDTIAHAFANRNVQLCALISVLLVSYLVCCWAFMPLYLTANRGFSADTAKWLMATLGFSAAVGSFAVSALSDRVGRKPVIVGFSLLGVILPLGAMYFMGSTWLLAAIFFVGWGLNGVFPVFMAAVPSESVDPRLTASLSGITIGVGDGVGGVLSPYLAGSLSDHFNDRSAVLWLMLGMTLLAALVGMGLRETAPRVLARRAAAGLRPAECT